LCFGATLIHLRLTMAESPHIPKFLWPPALLLGVAIGYTVNVIERNWRPLKQRRSQSWRAKLG